MAHKQDVRGKYFFTKSSQYLPFQKKSISSPILYIKPACYQYGIYAMLLQEGGMVKTQQRDCLQRDRQEIAIPRLLACVR